MILLTLALAATPPVGCEMGPELERQLDTLPEAKIHWDLRGGRVREPPTAQAWVLCRRKRLSVGEADVLASFGGTVLAVPAVAAIEPEVGASLGAFAGTALLLDGLQSVPAALPRRWNETETPSSRVLSLSGLEALDVETARWLGHPATERLVVGLPAMTPTLTASLHNQEVSWPRVEALPLAVAEVLDTKGTVEMPALRALDPEVASAARVGHWVLGIETASADLVKALDGSVDLPRVTTLSTEAIGALKGHRVLGLTTLSPEQASALMVYELTLPNVDSLSLDTAKALAGNRRLSKLTLPGLTSVSDDVAAALQRRPSGVTAENWVQLPELTVVGHGAVGLFLRNGWLHLEGKTLLPGTLEAIELQAIRSIRLPRVPTLEPLAAFGGSLSIVGTPSGLSDLKATALTVRIEAGDDPTLLPTDGPPLTLIFADDRVITLAEAEWMKTRKPKELHFAAMPSVETAKVLLTVGAYSTSKTHALIRSDVPLHELAAGRRIATEQGPPCEPRLPGPRQHGWYDHTAGRDGWPGQRNVPWILCGLTHLDLATAERLQGYRDLVLPSPETAEDDAWDLLTADHNSSIVVFWDDLKGRRMELVTRPRQRKVAIYGLRSLSPEQARDVKGVNLIFGQAFGMEMAEALPYGASIFVEQPLDRPVLQRLYDRHIQSRQVSAADLRPQRPADLPEDAFWLSATDGFHLGTSMSVHKATFSTPDGEEVLEIGLFNEVVRLPWPADRPRYDAGASRPEPIDVKVDMAEVAWFSRGDTAIQLHSVRLSGDRSSAWATLFRRDPSGVEVARAPLAEGAELSFEGEVLPIERNDRGRFRVSVRGHAFHPSGRPSCFQDLCVAVDEEGTDAAMVITRHGLVPMEPTREPRR
jgi:hypothetical protein